MEIPKKEIQKITMNLLKLQISKYKGEKTYIHDLNDNFQEDRNIEERSN